MFAGFDGSSSLTETWSYDAAQNLWTLLSPEGEGQPSSAKQMSGAYDPTTRKVITFDGTSWGYQVGENAWSALGPGGDKLRPARYGVSMVKDDTTGKVILFGGTDMSVSYQETWSYDPIANTWTNMKPEGEVPSGRSDAGMTYDPRTGKVILFGGVDSDFNCLDDTWAYDSASNSWTEYATGEAPSARSGVGLAYDPHSGVIVLFGGIDSQLVCYSDTWAFDPSTGGWTQLTPTGYVPIPRARTMLTYSADIDKLVLFGGVGVQADETGGFGYLVYLNDVWAYGVQGDVQEAKTPPPSETAVTSTTLLYEGQETTSTAP